MLGKQGNTIFLLVMKWLDIWTVIAFSVHGENHDQGCKEQELAVLKRSGMRSGAEHVFKHPARRYTLLNPRWRTANGANSDLPCLIPPGPSLK